LSSLNICSLEKVENRILKYIETRVDIIKLFILLEGDSVISKAEKKTFFVLGSQSKCQPWFP